MSRYPSYPLAWGDGNGSERDKELMVRWMRDRERPMHRAYQAGFDGFAWSEVNWPTARLDDCRMAWESGQAERRFVRWWRFRVKTYKLMWRVGRTVAPKTTRRLKHWRRQRLG